jgi:uncharacterized membrane protein (DUF373 family)
MQFDEKTINNYILSAFNRTVSIVFGVILIFLMLGIIIGTAKLFFNLGDMVMSGSVTGSYLKTISDVLSLFILIELSRSLISYFDCNRIRLTFILDAAIVFVLREIMIKMFQDKIDVNQIYAVSALLFVLGLVRMGSGLLYQREINTAPDTKDNC